jgi:archaellum component FlaC
MMTNRFTILAICLAVGLGTVTDQAMAKKKNKNKKSDSSTELYDYDHPSGKGYPNGRPWQALDYDFDVVKHKLNVIDYKVDDVKEDTETIIDQTGEVQTDIDNLEMEIADIKDGVGEILEEVDGLDDDVSMLKNTLSVDISVGAATDDGITLYVQVAQNGMGVTKLAADAFEYGNSFPADGAKYCGADCFAEGIGGVYMIELLVDSGPGSYAGALGVSMEVVDDDDDDDDDDGDDPEIANGTALVTFEVEEAPEPN